METLMILIGALIQISIAIIVSFNWWFVTQRKKLSYFNWIGLKKPIINEKTFFKVMFIRTIILFNILGFIIIPIITQSADLATSQFQGKGIKVLISALIYSFLQTALSEEILFRGFLAKRFINKFGFNIGNIIQSTIFGLLHGVMLISYTGILKSIIAIIFTGTIGWLMCYINEKLSDGSIIPSWCLHGVSNIISSLVSMFNLL